MIVAGAGMAGLCAAARGRQLGLRPVVLEKGDRAGGSMLLSSCVVWRYRSLDEFRLQCPHGDPVLQRLVVERLDAALDWLERIGAPAVARETCNPLTVGRRFDPRRLTEALARAAEDIRLRTPLPPLPGRIESSSDLQAPVEPLVLATGGFQGDRELVARFVRPAAPLPLRANPWSTGDGLRLALERGAVLSPGLDEFYGRNMPDAPFDDSGFVSLAQLYGRYAVVVDDRGERFGPSPPSWSETDLVQATARRPGAAAWYLLDRKALRSRVRDRTVAEMVEAARNAGGTVKPAEALPFPAPRGCELAVRVRASITHTIGGVRVDERARVLREDGSAIEGLYAAGVDAGGIATGGYASGLAAALVLGVVAAEEVAS